jgi:hypothetical protein
MLLKNILLQPRSIPRRTQISSIIEALIRDHSFLVTRQYRAVLYSKSINKQLDNDDNDGNNNYDDYIWA